MTSGPMGTTCPGCGRPWNERGCRPGEQVEQLRRDFDRATAWGSETTAQLATTRQLLSTMHAGNWPDVLVRALASLAAPTGSAPLDEPAPKGHIPCKVCGKDGYCGTHNDRNIDDDDDDDEPAPKEPT